MTHFWTLFTLEALAKFTIRIIQASLVLYVLNFIHPSNTLSYNLTASYGIITYAFPIIAGFIADRYIGIKNAMGLGCLLMLFGSFSLLVPSKLFLIIGLVLLGVGSGFFKPNILAILDTIFPKNDDQRAKYFEKFYLSSSVGDVIALLFAGIMPLDTVFVLCVLSCLLKAFLFFKNRLFLTKEQVPFFKSFLLIGGLIGSFILMVLFDLNLLIILLAIFVAVFGGKKYLGRAKKDILIIVGYASLFFSFVVQCYFALSIIVETLVDREIGGWVIPSAWFMLVNPVTCLVLGSLISRAVKRFDLLFRMMFGLWMVGIGYLCLFCGMGEKIHLIWILAAYLFFVIGELSVIPRLISRITHLFEDHFKSQGVGFWYFTMALAQYLAGIFANILYADQATKTTASIFFGSFVVLMGLSALNLSKRV